MPRRHASAPNCCHLDDQPTQGLPLDCKSFTAHTPSTAGTDLRGRQQVGDGGALGGGCSLVGLHAPLCRLCSAPRLFASVVQLCRGFGPAIRSSRRIWYAHHIRTAAGRALWVTKWNVPPHDTPSVSHQHYSRRRCASARAHSCLTHRF